eukprot:scaffold4472_cov180-Amphora_coffeaeformis.AAC.12
MKKPTRKNVRKRIYLQANQPAKSVVAVEVEQSMVMPTRNFRKNMKEGRDSHDIGMASCW